MRALARLETELRASGTGYVVLAVAGLVGTLVEGTSVARTLVPFVVVAAALALVQWRAGFSWIRRTAEAAQAAPGSAELEPAPRTVRRTCASLLVYLLAVVAALVIGRGLGAVVGGIAAGVGLVDLYAVLWVRAREDDEAVALLRESPASPFGSGRRPIYTRPISASTLAT